jgi:hypothetical protein
MAKTTKDVLQRVKETLSTAEFGLTVMKHSKTPEEHMAGVRNVVVFGRAVTNVLQNLRSTNPEFDDWYASRRQEMESDDLMKFIYKLRSKILKEGNLPTGARITMDGNPMEFIRRFQPPSGAKGFFIGDHRGGTGWEVELPDGTTERLYVTIPSDSPLKIEATVHLQDAPAEFKELSVDEICQLYISKLQELVAIAKATFK